MLQVNIMPVEKFLETEADANVEKLKLMYERIKAVYNAPFVRLDWTKMPVYETQNGIFGGGEFVNWLSHREGYGFTIVKSEERGGWSCGIRSDKKTNYRDIVFYDGEFEEVFEALAKRFI